MIPIESIYSSKVGIRDVKGLIKFMKKYNIKRGFVITEDYEETEKLEDKVIIFVPLWKWVFGYQPKHR
jgi:predicted AAA+ superfamily ATPase